MSLLNRLGTTVSRFGSLAGKALKPLGAIAQPLAGAVGSIANTFLPSGVAKVVSSVAQKASDFVTSGRAQEIADKVARSGMALANMKSVVPEGY